jgi:hypothetical protein
MPKQKPIERLVQHVLDAPYLDEVDKQIIIARLFIVPSESEIAQARARAAKGHNASQ